MFTSVSKRIGIVLCLTIFFVICDFVAMNSGLAVLNTHFVFGLFGTNLIAALISLVALMLLWAIVWRYENALWPLALISSATLANIIDRLLYGGVVDYFKLPFIPTFNISDVMIVAGLIYISKTLIFAKKS